MSSIDKLNIKELLNFFEKEVVPKLESIDSNLEVLTEKFLGKQSPVSLSESLRQIEIDDEHGTKIKRI